ncbi:hypothetical protein PAMP_020319 [Pampus punctatissimus]
MDEMDCVIFLTDEKFDFDVPVSPASAPYVSRKIRPVSGAADERCVSVNVASHLEIGGGGVRESWSPLTGDQLEAMCQEAHRVADQLQSTEPDATTNMEHFVEDSDAKLGVFGQPATALSPIKRQTFCVQDSPLKELPPAIQRRLQRGNGSTAAPPTRRASTTRHNTSNSEAKPKMVLRGKAALGVGIVLPSKPAVPSTSCTASNSRMERTSLQPASKMMSWRRSPSSHPSSQAESCEDLPSDSTSVASDISDSSLNSSMLGKRISAPPTKVHLFDTSWSLRFMTVKENGVNAPPRQSRRLTERKNTSSSSVSSLSLSPAAGTTTLCPVGKLNSSLNRRRTSCAVPAPGSVSRPANQNRPQRSTAYTAAEPSAIGRRSLSTQVKKLSEAFRSTPLKRTEATPQQTTPAKRLSERTASIPTSARWQSGLKALIPPTRGGGVGAGCHGDCASSPNVSKTLKPNMLMSASSVDRSVTSRSLPQKPVGPVTPSAGSCRSQQVKVGRPSALPTPLRRRMSSIPVATPTNQTRPARPPPTSDSASARKASGCSPASADTQEAEPVDAPHIQPFCLEEEEKTRAAPPPTAPQPDQSESMDTGALSQSQSEPRRNLIELETTEEKTTQEVLLLDLPPPALQPEEKLLIDLTNTPDSLRPKTGTTTQLIDLSSPLIKWSPEDKKENNAVLINLSF